MDILSVLSCAYAGAATTEVKRKPVGDPDRLILSICLQSEAIPDHLCHGLRRKLGVVDLDIVFKGNLAG